MVVGSHIKKSAQKALPINSQTWKTDMLQVIIILNNFKIVIIVLTFEVLFFSPAPQMVSQRPHSLQVDM
jgi:hypothetical protein